MKTDKLLKAMQKHDDAVNAVVAAFAAAYPVGSTIYWMHGEHEQRGEVVDAACTDHAIAGVARVRARNVRTGTLRWVTAYGVVSDRYGYDWKKRR